jgi:hypothetical protein
MQIAAVFVARLPGRPLLDLFGEIGVEGPDQGLQRGFRVLVVLGRDLVQRQGIEIEVFLHLHDQDLTAHRVSGIDQLAGPPAAGCVERAAQHNGNATAQMKGRGADQRVADFHALVVDDLETSGFQRHHELQEPVGITRIRD